MEIIKNSQFLIALFFIQIYTLSLVRNSLFNQVYRLLYKVFKSNKIVIFVISFLYLPGTIIHELSHVLAAIFLRAKVTAFSVWPKYEKDTIKLGYAEITKLDVFRNMLIGISPLIFGLIINYFLIINFINSDIYVQLLYLYLIFQISNSMFLSKSDLQEFKFLLLVSLVVFSIAYFVDLLYFNQQFFYGLFIEIKFDLDFLLYLNFLFILTLFFNILILLFVKLLNYLKTY